MIYSKDEPFILDGEEGMLRPIRVKTRSGRSLDKMARVNFGKSYPIEHNIKVMEIGDVIDKENRVKLRHQFRQLQAESDEE